MTNNLNEQFQKEMNLKQNLLEVYKLNNDMVKFFSEREWKTIKFFTTVFFGLLAASATIMGFFITADNISLKILLFLVIIFPLFMYHLSIKGLENFRRENDRLLERMAIAIKTEELLGFNDKRESIKEKLSIEKNLLCFKNDEYLLSDDFINAGQTYDSEKNFRSRYLSGDDLPFYFFKWLKGMAGWVLNRENRKEKLEEYYKENRHGNTYRIFSKVFRAYAGFSLIYLVVILIIWLFFLSTIISSMICVLFHWIIDIFIYYSSTFATILS